MEATVAALAKRVHPEVDYTEAQLRADVDLYAEQQGIDLDDAEREDWYAAKRRFLHELVEDGEAWPIAAMQDCLNFTSEDLEGAEQMGGNVGYAPADPADIPY